MNADNRYPVTASLFMLREIKRRHEQVHRGHQLLKRKAEALRIRGRLAASELTGSQAKIIPTLRDAYICLAAAKFSNGENNPNAMVLENIGQAQLRVTRVTENTSGVTTMSLMAVEEESGAGDTLRLAGLAVGGHQLGEAKKAFRDTLLELIKLASLRNTCVLLDDAVRSTMRKVNGISKVIIPKLENTEKYIIMEMDEREREEFHRLKMVKAKKVRAQVLAAIKSDDNERVKHGGFCKGILSNLKLIGGVTVQQVSAFRANDHQMSILYPSGRPTSTSSRTDSGDEVTKPLCFPHNWDDEDLLF